MAYQRASWHSGLTYIQTCEKCKTRVSYKDDALDFRPWYADGFVYCPTCKTPLRHNEKYAVDQPAPAPAPAPAEPAAPVVGGAQFCSGCGRAFGEGENFCPNCGKKKGL